MKRLCALMMIGVICILLCACSKDEGKSEEVKPSETVTATEATEETLPYDNDFKDADEYFHKNTNVHEEFTIEFANNIQTEKEAYDALSVRGFSTFSILAEYDMQGISNPGYEISADSDEKHPVYQTYYVTATGDTWMLLMINGEIMANPLSFNQYSPKIIVLSEKDTITSYDNALNKFYVNTPKEGVTSVKKIDRIDAETLERLTAEELSKL